MDKECARRDARVIEEAHARRNEKATLWIVFLVVSAALAYAGLRTKVEPARALTPKEVEYQQRADQEKKERLAHFEIAKEAVQKRLLSPTVARFDLAGFYVSDGIATGQVHSQNMFGATITSRYEVDIRNQSATFSLEKYKSNDERIWKQ